MMLIPETITHFYGRGEAWIGDAVAGGMPNKMISISDIDAVEMSLNTELLEHMSKRDVTARKHLSVAHSITGTGKLTCSLLAINLLKLYPYGSQTTISGGSVSATAFAQST